VRGSRKLVAAMTLDTGRKPLSAMMKHVNRAVRVTLKNDYVYEGTMVDCDSYMNIVMEKAVEFGKDERKVQYSSVLIRGNNVVYIQLFYGKEQ